MNKKLSILLLTTMLCSNILPFIVKPEPIEKPINFKPLIIEKGEKMGWKEFKEIIEAKKKEPIYLGDFWLTAYCNCEKCCGKWAGGPTATGVMPKADWTIAVDPSVIPLGSKVQINGHTYCAEDTGSAIKGNKIDIYVEDHNDCYNENYNGMAAVYLIPEE